MATRIKPKKDMSVPVAVEDKPNGIKLRVDEGTKTCFRCEMGASYKKGHDHTCPFSRRYRASPALRRSQSAPVSGYAPSIRKQEDVSISIPKPTLEAWSTTENANGESNLSAQEGQKKIDDTNIDTNMNETTTGNWSVCETCKESFTSGDDTPVKCHGDNCRRRFHLQCIQVPRKSRLYKSLHGNTVQPSDHLFLCASCSVEGSSTYLVDYFEKFRETKVKYFQDEECVDSRTSSDFVAHLLKKASGKMKTKKRQPIKSEVTLSLMYRIQKGMLTSSSNAVPDPLILVGLPVRFYCDIDNKYHVGRIIDWRDHRSKSNFPKKKSNNHYHQDEKLGEMSYLIRFRHGMNGRNVAFHQWVFLEEHPLMIGFSCIWVPMSKPPFLLAYRQEDSVSYYRPAQIMLRTALEMSPVRPLNDPMEEDEVQAIILLFGKDHHQGTLRLAMKDPEVVQFGSGINEEKIRKELPNHDKNLALAVAAGCMECEEQRRIRVWHKLDSGNAKPEDRMV